MSLYTFVFLASLHIEYGTVTFGAEPLREIGNVTGLPFRICTTVPADDGWTVYGLKRNKKTRPEVWSAWTSDGMKFMRARRLFQLPPPETRWLAGDVAVDGDGGVYLMICDCGDPPTSGHRFHVFADRGDGWQKLNDAPVYKGQDAFGLVWNDDRFVNYQTSYQRFEKRFADNMGNDIRRVMHIRTSADLIHWTPGGSFGVTGPYLPDDQLITPDDADPDGTEFYKFRACRTGNFWTGVLTKYTSQPQVLAKAGHFPHGPLLDSEWCVSRDGIAWERPMRTTSALRSTPFQLGYYLHPPFTVGHDLRWAESGRAYAHDRRRRFYAYSLGNAAMTTEPLTFERSDARLHIAFESVLQDKTFALRQGYVMAELVNDDGKPLPGFEKENCFLEVGDDTVLPLRWNDHTPDALPAPHTARLRVYFRDARVYSLEY